ncbi:MAG: hypothetical protein ACKVVT_00300 [Dehalococcoidia bacterium]
MRGSIRRIHDRVVKYVLALSAAYVVLCHVWGLAPAERIPSPLASKLETVFGYGDQGLGILVALTGFALVLRAGREPRLRALARRGGRVSGRWRRPAPSDPLPDLTPVYHPDDWIAWTPKMHERLVAQTGILRGREPELAWHVQPVEPPHERVPGPFAPRPARQAFVRTAQPPPSRPPSAPRRGALSRGPG